MNIVMRAGNLAVLSLCTVLLSIACGDDPVPLVAGTSTAGADRASTAPGGALQTHELSLSVPGKVTKISAEIAATNEQRALGLMFRQSLSKDAGMLFLYPEDQTSGHWMRNTYIALDIAYIDRSGTVLEVRLGKPLDETVLRPAKPYRYALEMSAGWFAEHGLGVDTRISLPGDLPVAK